MCVCVCVCKCVCAQGGVGVGGDSEGKTRGGDISRETVDKCGRLAEAYLVRGVVPPCFIC